MEAIASFFSLKPLLLNVKEVVMFTEARDCQLNVVLFQGPTWPSPVGTNFTAPATDLKYGLLLHLELPP